VAFTKSVFGNSENIERIENSFKKKLGVSLPFLTQISKYMINPCRNSYRPLVLLQCANLFKNPDKVIIDIGTTLEFLHTASLLHRNINDAENARRHFQHVEKIWGSEAGVLLGDYLLSLSFEILTGIGNLEVLECVSLATQNISRGQILEISKSTLTATPEHWNRVTRYKIAGLYGAGAQSAAYWGKASKETASKLFSFGEHLGVAIQLKKDLKILGDKKLVIQKLNDRELWSPLCFLIHDCMEESESNEMLNKLSHNFDPNQIASEIDILFKRYELPKKIELEAKRELRIAKDFVKQLKFDTTPIQPLIQYSNI